MRRILSIFICLFLLCAVLPLSAVAESGEVTLTASSATVAQDSTVNITVALGDEASGFTADSLEIRVSHSKTYFEFVSGRFLSLENSAAPKIEDGTATISYVKPVTLKGGVFEFTLKGLQIHNLERTVRVTVTAKNAGSVVLEETVETAVKIICKNHSFSHWVIDAAADCENAGEQHRKCSVCETEETEEIAAYGHDFLDMETLRAATCTEIGYERGFCTRCRKKLLQQIAAKGHSMSEFKVDTPAGCITKGLEISKCKSCDHTETRDAEPIGHEFINSVVTTEPTISTNGIRTGFCKRCSETTTTEVPCAHTDSATGIGLDTVYGVFPEGTKVNIEKLESGSGYDFVKKSIAHITNTFVSYDIKTTHLGAEVKPDGEVIVTFPIPARYGKKADFFYITEEGTVKKLKATINDDGTTATLKFTNTGKYVICKTGLAAGIAGYSAFNGITPLKLIILSAIALIICWSLVALRIIKLKKPELYKRIIHVFPTASEIKNFAKREYFIAHEAAKARAQKKKLAEAANIKAVVFDLDHTLFDRYATFESILEQNEAYTVFKKSAGKKNILREWSYSDKQYLHSEERHWDFTYEHLMEKGMLLKKTQKENFFKNCIYKLFMLTAIPFPDTVSTLKALKAAGFKLGIITNGSHELQTRKIELLGIKDYFDEIIISKDLGTHKPDRKLFDIMCERLEIKSEDILFVGDNPINDIDGARKAGYKTAWISTVGFWATPKIKKADFEIDTLSDLLNIFGI